LGAAALALRIFYSCTVVLEMRDDILQHPGVEGPRCAGKSYSWLSVGGRVTWETMEPQVTADLVRALGVVHSCRSCALVSVLD